MFNLNHWKTALLVTVVAAGLALPSADAGQRRFAYSYETLTAPKGSIELENWVTWKHTDLVGGDDKDVYQFRHEIEFGVTDRLQLALYVADWQYNEDDEEGHSARYSGSGLEVIYNLTNPNTDFLGSALYGEVIVGEDLVELEGKILLEKRFGNLDFVYNAVLEAEWEGNGLDEKTGEFQQTLGISYDITKSFSLGVEAVHEIEMPEWEEAESGRFFVGPNVSFRSGRFYGTLAWLWQTTHVEDEPDFQPRLIVGFNF
jgi:hypothetical protein